MHFLFENELDNDWKYYADHDEGGNVLNDPELKQKVIQATRRYFEHTFDAEDVIDSVRVSIVDTTEGISYEMPDYEVKIVAVFKDDVSDVDSNVLRAINKRLERQLDSDGEGRYVTANLSPEKGGRIRLEYVGPGIYDNAGKPFKTRDDYFRGIMTSIKADIDTIYRAVGYEF